MKPTLIPKIEIENRHPKGLTSTTDMEYARIATEVLDEMSKLGIDDIPVSGLRLLALNIALYFEDVVADAGIWRSFTDKVKELYGRRLPFYDIDENDYYQDEPNLADVKLLVWYTMLEVHNGRIGNPENPVLEKLACAAYSVLDRHFETVSVNENLKEFFANPQFLDDFYVQRNMLNWFVFGCYLTYIPNAVDMVLDYAHSMANAVHCDLHLALYHVEGNFPYMFTVGPLKLKPQQWLGMVLRANGNEEAAKRVEVQKYKEYKPYKIVKIDDKINVTFEDVDGEQFFVENTELNMMPDAPMAEGNLGISAFVEYDGAWHLNGAMSWNKTTRAFDDMRKEYEGHKNLHGTYDKLVSESGGSRLLYFADTQQMKDFFLEKLSFEENVAKNFSLPEGHENIVLYIPEDYGDFQILPDGALCIKDERNSYYNQKWAKNQALNFVLSVRPEVQSYLVSHGLLPDATINSSKGLERGNEIVQQNFDFLVKAVSSRLHL